MTESLPRSSPEHRPSADGAQPINPEVDRGAEPRIYVASLTDYNHGVLHGEWIGAHRDADALHDKTQAMLAKSPTARRHGERAEEWAIHDYEGFGQIRLSEYEDLAVVARLATGIVEQGPAFAAWVDHRGKYDEVVDEFDDHYFGEWKSVEDYAEHVLDDLGYLDEIEKVVPEHLRPYVTIDTSGFGRDLVLSGDIWAHENSEGKVWVFDGRG